MTDTYGPPDSSIPEWAAPGGSASTGAGGTPPGPGASPSPRPTAPGARPSPGVTASSEPTYRSWQPGIMALRPLTFGDFIALPFKAMRYNRAVVVGAPLILSIFSTATTVAAVWLLVNDPFLNYAGIGPIADPKPETLWALVANAVVTFVSTSLIGALVAPGIARAVLGERISLSAAWAAVRQRLLPVFAVAGIAVLAWIVPLTVMIVLVVLAFSAGLGGLGGLILALGIPAYIVFALHLSVISGVAQPAVVLEREGPIATIRRVIRLVRGRAWWSVLVVLVNAMIIGIASYIFQFGGSLIGSVALIAAPESATGFVIYLVLVGLGSLVGGVLTASFMSGLYAFLYVDLRIRHEGFDVDLAEAAEAKALRP